MTNELSNILKIFSCAINYENNLQRWDWPQLIDASSKFLPSLILNQPQHLSDHQPAQLVPMMSSTIFKSPSQSPQSISQPKLDSINYSKHLNPQMRKLKFT